MKAHMYSYTLIMLVAALTAACSAKTPKLMAPPETYSDAKVEGGDFQIEFNPKVDILFVVDNSASMEDTQTALSHNIDSFVDAFAKNEIIDFHIGVVSVFDSVRQKPGVPAFYPRGQLRPLKGEGQSPDQPGFITRSTANWPDVLKASLKLGVLPLWQEPDCNSELQICTYAGGPEFEELFTPVRDAFKEPMLSGANNGFYRPEAHLAVIFVSDADAASNEMTPNQLKSFLVDMKGKNESLISTHGVIFPDDRSTCESPLNEVDAKTGKRRLISRDPGARADRLVNFLSITQGTVKSLCDKNYGQHLAEIGHDISKRALARVIPLDSIPERNTIEVRYGSQIIPPDDQKGWTHNRDINAIVISGDVAVTPEPGAQISVHFTKAKFENIRNGRTVMRH